MIMQHKLSPQALRNFQTQQQWRYECLTHFHIDNFENSNYIFNGEVLGTCENTFVSVADLIVWADTTRHSFLEYLNSHNVRGDTLTCLYRLVGNRPGYENIEVVPAAVALNFLEDRSLSNIHSRYVAAHNYKVLYHYFRDDGKFSPVDEWFISQINQCIRHSHLFTPLLAQPMTH